MPDNAQKAPLHPINDANVTFNVIAPIVLRPIQIARKNLAMSTFHFYERHFSIGNIRSN